MAGALLELDELLLELDAPSLLVVEPFFDELLSLDEPSELLLELLDSPFDSPLAGTVLVPAAARLSVR